MRDPNSNSVVMHAIDVFSSRMSRKARSEGWDLFDHEGEVRIQRYDENPKRFTRDDQVIEHCIRQALRGSKLHLLALYLEGRKCGANVDVTTPLVSMVAAGVRHKTYGRQNLGPLEGEEKAMFANLQEARDEGRLCLVRCQLDRKTRAAVCSVTTNPEGGYNIEPLAVLLTPEQYKLILDPEGRPTSEDAITDLVSG